MPCEELEKLLKKLEERLQRFRDCPEIVKGMNEPVAMGVQHGRIVALKTCIEELRSVIKCSVKNNIWRNK